MKRLINFFLFLTGMAFIVAIFNACSNSNYLVGIWKQEKIEYIPIKTKLVKETNMQPALELDENKIEPKQGEIVNETATLKFKKSLSNVSSPNINEIKSNYKPSMVFRTDKTATLIFLNDTVNGFWKMKSSNNKIIIKDIVSNLLIILDSINLKSDILTLSEKYSDGIFKVYYKKQ